MKPGTTIHTVQLKNCVVVIKNVPCMKCEQCGEVVLSADTIEKIERILQTVEKAVAEITVVNFPWQCYTNGYKTGRKAITQTPTSDFLYSLCLGGAVHARIMRDVVIALMPALAVSVKPKALPRRARGKNRTCPVPSCFI